jgi:hypothetical protein
MLCILIFLLNIFCLRKLMKEGTKD